jgi:hypothetical protein
MGEGHIQRLRRLVVCPVPGCGCAAWHQIDGVASVQSLDVAFSCGARFHATEVIPIVAVAACRTRTDIAARLLNDEVRSLHKPTGGHS